jgi:hypothetical protein
MRVNHDTTMRAQPIFSATCSCSPAGHLINTTEIQEKLVGMEPTNLDSYIYIDCSSCLPGWGASKTDIISCITFNPNQQTHNIPSHI